MYLGKDVQFGSGSHLFVSFALIFVFTSGKATVCLPWLLDPLLHGLIYLDTLKYHKKKRRGESL